MVATRQLEPTKPQQASLRSITLRLGTDRMAAIRDAVGPDVDIIAEMPLRIPPRRFSLAA